jgi:hypothetical protein
MHSLTFPPTVCRVPPSPSSPLTSICGGLFPWWQPFSLGEMDSQYFWFAFPSWLNSWTFLNVCICHMYFGELNFLQFCIWGYNFTFSLADHCMWINTYFPYVSFHCAHHNHSHILKICCQILDTKFGYKNIFEFYFFLTTKVSESTC